MTDRVILAFTIIIAAVYLYATTLIPSLEIGDPLGPKAFPRLLGVGLLLAGVMLGFEIWGRKVRAPEVPASNLFDPVIIRVLLCVVAWTGQTTSQGACSHCWQRSGWKCVRGSSAVPS